jgi:EAL domain-containing protein (putative c-di-GMP-specific phosphodiesterase class I)
MAFQPIIDVVERKILAQEALVRGAAGEGAGVVLSQISDESRYAFDQLCRTTAIDLAARLGLADDGALLSINFLPNAVYEPRACIRQTLLAAERAKFPLRNILFEFTEAERVDTAHLLGILNAYRAIGFKTAIDDFGSGYSGLRLLAEFQPDFVKIDMDLVRGVDRDRARRAIVANVLRMMRDLEIEVVCEGVETVDEYQCLRDLGVRLMQGYLFAKPAFAALAAPNWP